MKIFNIRHVALVSTVVFISMAFSLMDYSSEDKDQRVFVHSVYFWLKEDVTVQQKDRFLEILRNLEQIKSVDDLEIGIPAGTPRVVVDNSYDVALLVYFRDREAHDLYQADALHKSAVAEFEEWISQVKIYDAICAH